MSFWPTYLDEISHSKTRSPEYKICYKTRRPTSDGYEFCTEIASKRDNVTVWRMRTNGKNQNS